MMLSRFSLTKFFQLNRCLYSNSIQYKSFDSQDLQFFKNLLNQNEYIDNSNPDLLQPYNNDWTKKYLGKSQLILKPTSVNKIQEILKYCNTNRLAIVPQSGNTSLTGSSVPVQNEIILSLKQLNKIKNFDEQTSILTCDSGVILHNANEFLSKYNYQIPWDLGSSGSCLIGGNLSTNAGGKYFIKYGSLRKNVTGLQVILANGSLLDLSSEVRKDNSGYDLKQLFIGSEGLLGIITQCNIHCVKIQKYKELLFFQLDSFENLLSLYKLAQQEFGNQLAACEYMDQYAFITVLNQLSTVQNPFEKMSNLNESYNYFDKYSHYQYLLLEIQSDFPVQNQIDEFYEKIDKDVIYKNQQKIKDAIISQNVQQFSNIWNIRELIGTACGMIGPVLKYDISLNPQFFNDLVQKVRDYSSEWSLSVGYGHIGDGNLHINIACKQHLRELKEEQKKLDDFVYNYVRDSKGSISAEHGIGQLKINYLPYSKSNLAIHYMKDIKNLFDPNHILNPYKVLSFQQ